MLTQRYLPEEFYTELVAPLLYSREAVIPTFTDLFFRPSSDALKSVSRCSECQDIFGNTILHYLVLVDGLEQMEFLKKRWTTLDQKSVWERLKNQENIFGEAPCHWILSIPDPIRRNEFYKIITEKDDELTPPECEEFPGKKILSSALYRIIYSHMNIYHWELFQYTFSLLEAIRVLGTGLEQRFKRAYVKLFNHFQYRPFTVLDMKNALRDENIPNYQEVIVELKKAGLIERVSSNSASPSKHSFKRQVGRPPNLYRLRPFFAVSEYPPTYKSSLPFDPCLNIVDEVFLSNYRLFSKYIAYTILPSLSLFKWLINISSEKFYLAMVEKFAHTLLSILDQEEKNNYDLFSSTKYHNKSQHALPHSKFQNINALCFFQIVWNDEKNEKTTELKTLDLWDECLTEFFQKTVRELEIFRQRDSFTDSSFNITLLGEITSLSLLQEFSLKKETALSIETKFLLSRLILSEIMRYYKYPECNLIFPFFDSDYTFIYITYFLWNNLRYRGQRIKLFIGEHFENDDPDLLIIIKRILGEIGIDLQVKRFEQQVIPKNSIIVLTMPYQMPLRCLGIFSDKSYLREILWNGNTLFLVKIDPDMFSTVRSSSSHYQSLFTLNFSDAVELIGDIWLPLDELRNSFSYLTQFWDRGLHGLNKKITIARFSRFTLKLANRVGREDLRVRLSAFYPLCIKQINDLTAPR